MESTLGQPLAVENKPGANGAVAAQYVAQAEPDGYTLFFTTAGAIAISPAFHSDLNYDPIKDFAPVGEAAINSPVLVVNAGMKVNSARELAELARKKPGAITVGITGRGAMSDLALQLFDPYRGAAQAITDVLGGRLDGLVGDIPTVLGQVRAGKLSKRLPPRPRSAPTFSGMFRPSSNKALPASSATTGPASWRRPPRRLRSSLNSTPPWSRRSKRPIFASNCAIPAPRRRRARRRGSKPICVKRSRAGAR
jgi:hypothetical protein